MQEIRKKFDIAPYAGEGPYHPEALHTFGLYLDGKWFKMTAKEEIITDDPVLGPVSYTHLSTAGKDCCRQTRAEGFLAWESHSPNG